MKLKKVTKDYEMLCFIVNEGIPNQEYIPANVLKRDMSVKNAAMVFYLIYDREDDRCKCAGKAIIRKCDLSASLRAEITPAMKFAGVLSPASYEYNLSLVDSALSHTVKSIFCAKITHTIMNEYGSHLYLFINGDDAIRKVAAEVGYRPVDENRVMFEQDDLLALKAVSY